MNNDKPAPPRSYVTPWTSKAYDALPGSPIRIAIGFAIALLAAFFAGRALVDGPMDPDPRNLRVAIVLILLTAYASFAFAYLATVARRSVRGLAPAVGQTQPWQTIADRVGTYPWWALMLAGIAGILAYIPITASTAPEEGRWIWQNLPYDVRWHRVIGFFLFWWVGCLCYVLVTESFRLSRLSDSIESVDLVDLQPYRPLIRLGLTNALLMIGMASLVSPMLIESGLGSVVVGAWITSVIFAWIGLMLPLRGIRKKIRAAKDKELDWCRQALKTARNEMKAGAGGARSVAEIIAYRIMIEDIRNWPFDNPTLMRFALYLLIPLGS
ncbi:MAG: hypothetical protein O7H39_17950, partial [Gammaproteobacteria bacterium]|nr:hypothetical protein [Gammaproteobacteria bacterium]